jgi:hypothetical protein
MNWLVAVVLNTFNWKSEKKLFSVISLYILYCHYVGLLFYGFMVMPADWSHVSCHRQACVAANNF